MNECPRKLPKSKINAMRHCRRFQWRLRVLLGSKMMWPFTFIGYKFLFSLWKTGKRIISLMTYFQPHYRSLITGASLQEPHYRSLITGASPSFCFLYIYRKAIYKLGKKPGNEATPAPLYERSPSVVSTRYTVYVLEILWLVWPPSAAGASCACVETPSDIGASSCPV